MNPEIISYRGWDNTLRLANDDIELLVTTDVGPRILVCKTPSGENVLKTFDDQLGLSGEEEWRIRGGHRFWLAPEDAVLSYHLDNGPAHWRYDDFSGEVVVESIQERPLRIRKTLGILSAAHGSRVSLRHTVLNESDQSVMLAAWALTVMQPEGLQIIPQPPIGEHPRDLLPNRGIVLWAYTDLSDPRLTLGTKFWLLRQTPGSPPIKIGLAHRERWIAYVLSDTLFLKTFNYDVNAAYPDGGCNFETFTNSEMLEIESLGPLVTLQPGESTSHHEAWHLFPLTESFEIESEEALGEWITPFLERAGIS
ncbi:MAG TPA: hypothetical protein VIS96_15885 [Terrimicrobiaceae bacterium]